MEINKVKIEGKKKDETRKIKIRGDRVKNKIDKKKKKESLRTLRILEEGSRKMWKDE